MKKIVFFIAVLCCSAFAHPIGATESVPVQNTTIVAPSTTSEKFEETQKGGFFQKIMAKKAIKKIKNAVIGLTSGDDGLVAILAYLTVVGFVIALVMHFNNKTSLGGFHLAQVLGNIIFGAILGTASFLFAIIPFGFIVSMLLALCILINWIFGLVAAINGEEKPMPLFGKLFDKHLRRVFE